MFNLNPNILDISVDTSPTTALQFSLTFTSAYVNSMPFQLDLKKLVKLLGAESDAAKTLLQAVTTLIQVKGSGTISVSASARNRKSPPWNNAGACSWT